MRIVEKISVRDHQIFQITQLEFSSFRISFADSLCDICNEIAEALSLKINFFQEKN